MSVAALKREPNYDELNIGLTDGDREALIADISVTLADTFMVMVKTQGVHWNIAGPMFHSVHELTEEQYKDMFDATDDLAERIRALGGHAPASYNQYQKLSSLKDRDESGTAEQLMRTLIDDHEQIARNLRLTAGKTEKLQDWASHDLLTERLAAHEKAIWMLRSITA